MEFLNDEEKLLTHQLSLKDERTPIGNSSPTE